MVDQGVIAILTAGSRDAPATPDGSAPADSRLSVLDLESLEPGTLDDRVDAILYPITAATDCLHQEVARLQQRTTTVPVISYSVDDGAGEEQLRDLSRALGCAAHIEGPLSAAALMETVRRERQLAEALEALNQSREEARREHEKVTHLVDIIKTVNSVLEPVRVIDVVMEKAHVSLRSEIWCLFLLDEREETLTLARTGGVQLDNDRPYRVPLGRAVEGRVLETRRPLIINDLRNDSRHDPEFDRRVGVESRSVLAAPLISRGRVIGVVKLVNRLPGDFFSPADQSLVTLLMEPAAIALENAILFKKMEELSVTDDLTRLYNGRYLNSFLLREIKRCRRYHFPVSLIFLDMDGFKTVNDRFGHLAGSQTLTEIGQVLRQTVRDIDVVARYGGDEFVIVLPQTDAQGAMVIGERIRKRIENAKFLPGMGLSVHLTASLGISVFPELGRTRDELIHGADTAMYRVKGSGKNGVQLAQ